MSQPPGQGQSQWPGDGGQPYWNPQNNGSWSQPSSPDAQQPAPYAPNPYEQPVQDQGAYQGGHHGHQPSHDAYGQSAQGTDPYGQWAQGADPYGQSAANQWPGAEQQWQGGPPQYQQALFQSPGYGYDPTGHGSQPGWGQPPRKSRAGLLIAVLASMAALVLAAVVALVVVGSRHDDSSTASGASGDSSSTSDPASPSDSTSSDGSTSSSSSSSEAAPATQKVTKPHATFTVPDSALASSAPVTGGKDGTYVELSSTNLGGFYFRSNHRYDGSDRASLMNGDVAQVKKMPNKERVDETYVSRTLSCKGPVKWTTGPYATTLGTAYAVRFGFTCKNSTGRALAGQVAEIMDNKGYLHFLNFTGYEASYQANKASVDHIVSSFRSR